MSAIHQPNSVHTYSSFTHRPAVHRRAARWLTPLVGLSLFLVFGLAEAGACVSDGSSVPLRAGESWRGHLWGAVDAACFVVTVPEAGLLAIELTQRHDTPRAFVQLGEAELDRAEERHQIVRHTAGLLLLDAAPGRYGFRVRGVGGSGGEERIPFRVVTRFVSHSAPSKDEHDSEIASDFRGEPIDKDEHDSEIEIEPIDKRSADIASIPELSRGRLDALCAGTASASSLLCARPLAWDVQARGNVAAQWSDEARVFRFDTTSVGPVAIRARVLPRSDELAIELLDRSGQRLEFWTTADSGSNRVVVLVPGTYFVRLQSLHGGRSDYALRLANRGAD